MLTFLLSSIRMLKSSWTAAPPPPPVWSHLLVPTPAPPRPSAAATTQVASVTCPPGLEELTCPPHSCVGGGAQVSSSLHPAAIMGVSSTRLRASGWFFWALLEEHLCEGIITFLQSVSSFRVLEEVLKLPAVIQLEVNVSLRRRLDSNISSAFFLCLSSSSNTPKVLLTGSTW